MREKRTKCRWLASQIIVPWIKLTEVVIQHPHGFHKDPITVIACELHRYLSRYGLHIIFEIV